MAAERAGMGVPETVHADAAREVQVFLPVLGLERRALPADEDEARALVGVHEPVAHEIIVPMPVSLNSSTSSECGERPSTMWARSTPPSTALAQHSTFGIIPFDTMPSFT